MRLIITIYCALFAINFLFAQQRSDWYLEGNLCKFHQDGSKKYIEGRLIGGKVIKNFHFGAGLTYNYTRGNFKKVNREENIKYLGVAADVAYSFLEEKKISPMLKFSIGTGLISLGEDSIALRSGGTPYILNQNIQNWDDFLEGYFFRTELQSALTVMAAIPLSKNFEIDLGAGYQYRLLKKTPTFYFPEKYIHQFGLTINIGVRYIFKN